VYVNNPHSLQELKDKSCQHFNTTAPSLFSKYFRIYEAC